MSFSLSDAVRNARVAVIESTIGEAPTLQIRSGAPPANCAAAATGTLLASIALPTNWLDAPSAGSVSKSGTWEDPSADATGTAGHFRILQGATCHMQGSITAEGGSGPMIFDSVAVESGQQIRITTFTLTDADA